MKAWLPSHALNRFSQTAFCGLSAILLTIPTCFGQFADSNLTPQIQTHPDREHSILERDGRVNSVTSPRQSSSVPKPYSSNATGSPAAGTYAVARDGFRSEMESVREKSTREKSAQPFVAAPPVNRRAAAMGQLRPAANTAPPVSTTGFDQPSPLRAQASHAPVTSLTPSASTAQARHNQGLIVDQSVAPVSYTAPDQNFRNQPRFGSQPGVRSGSAPMARMARLNERDGSRPGHSGHPGRQPQKRAGSSNSSSSAKALIARFGYSETKTVGEVVPLRLADVLNQGQMRASRGQLVNQYWETFYDWAQSIGSKRHRDWVHGLRVSKSTDRATVGVAKSSAENEVTFNRIQLGKSRAKLKTMLGGVAEIAPADLPTVTRVKTNFQAFKERGLIPPRFEGIDQTLSDLHDLVVSRADTVTMAERTAQQVKEYYLANQTSVEHLLGAGRAWRAAEADFISSTIEYNKAYADYALALPYGQAPVEQVVAMLVAPIKSRDRPNSSSRSGLLSGGQRNAAGGSALSSPVVNPVPRGQIRRQNQSNSGIRAASNRFDRTRDRQSTPGRPVPDFSASAPKRAPVVTPQAPVFQPKPSASAPRLRTGTIDNRSATRPSAAALGQRPSTQPAASANPSPSGFSTASSSSRRFGGAAGHNLTGGSGSAGGFKSASAPVFSSSTQSPGASEKPTSQPLATERAKPQATLGGGGFGAADQPQATRGNHAPFGANKELNTSMGGFSGSNIGGRGSDKASASNGFNP